MIHRPFIVLAAQDLAKRLGEKLPVDLREAIRNDDAVTNVERIQHLLWMAKAIQGKSFSEAKATRWLCFLQGVAWSHKLITSGETQAQMYRIFFGEDPPRD